MLEKNKKGEVHCCCCYEARETTKSIADDIFELSMNMHEVLAKLKQLTGAQGELDEF